MSSSDLRLRRAAAEALAKRFALLDEGLRALVELMATNAQPMPVKVLQAITGEDIGTLETRLNTLVQRRMVLLLPERLGS